MGTFNYGPVKNEIWKSIFGYVPHLTRDIITYDIWENTEKEKEVVLEKYMEELANDRLW